VIISWLINGGKDGSVEFSKDELVDIRRIACGENAFVEMYLLLSACLRNDLARPAYPASRQVELGMEARSSGETLSAMPVNHSATEGL
jgi:hypothetical protein